MALNINGTTGISGVDGSASAPALQGTDSNTGINFASDTVNINTGGSTRVTVDSSGFLGVGTTSPSSFNADGRNLVVGTGSGGQGLSIYSANNNYGNIYFADGTSDGSYNAGGILYNHSSNFMRFDTAGAERMRVTSAGKFYVGTVNGAYGNDASQHAAIVNSTAVEYTLSLRNTVDAGGSDGRALLVACGKSTGGRLIFFERADGATVGSITHNGSATAFNTSSDYRLKENVTAISDGITRLKTLKPSRFNFKVDTDTTVDGFLAHEVTAVPEAVSGTKDEVDSDNKPIYQGIDQSKLVPLLTAALQEAIAKIEVLETKVAALEAG